VQGNPLRLGGGFRTETACTDPGEPQRQPCERAVAGTISAQAVAGTLGE
jgi:hypothetical protein